MLEQVVDSLKGALGNNLYSCCVYGSSVRGGGIEGVSDINILIILNESTPAAQNEIAQVIGGKPEVDPFVLGKIGFERSVRAFAPKFMSIQRNYRVIWGADPFANIQVDVQLQRFLCEQALRNLRLRLAYAFITRSRTRGYARFLAATFTPFILRVSEVMRLDGQELPKDLPARFPMISKTFGVEEALLKDLLAFKKESRKLTEEEISAWHSRLFPAVDRVIHWIETKWPS